MEEIFYFIATIGGYLGSVLATSFCLYCLCEEFKVDRKNYPNLNQIYLIKLQHSFILGAAIVGGYCGGYALTMLSPVIIPGCFVCEKLYTTFDSLIPYSKM